MLLNRIRPVVDIILRKNQNGFRTNRSTFGQILMVRRIIEGQIQQIRQLLSFSSISPNISIPYIEERWQRYSMRTVYRMRL